MPSLKVRGIEVMMRRSTCAAVVNDAAAMGRTNQCERGRHRMRAALAAARNVERDSATLPDDLLNSRVCQLAPQE